MTKKLIVRDHKNIKLRYRLEDGVIGSDYYKDHLVKQLPSIVPDLFSSQKRPLKILDIATGHGYSAIIMAKCYGNMIDKIIAYDINPKAVTLAKRNANLNKCEKKIDFRIGTLYEPLKKNECFDLIVSALPPIPISSDELKVLPSKIRSHHWVKSTGGPTGRHLIDEMIKDAKKYLFYQGAIITVHADFLNTETTLTKIQEAGLKGSVVGNSEPKKLKDTQLTYVKKKTIENLGYTFTMDRDGDEQFFIQVFFGQNF